MADVKWIKIVTDIFDDEKILLIESMPDADAIIVIWFKLLCLAGKQNNGGVFMLNDRIPYTEEMFATIFRRKPNTVKMALHTFEEFGMIEIINSTVTIPNWNKHQTLDSYEKKKARDRIYMQQRRAAQRALTLPDTADCQTTPSSDTSPDESPDRQTTPSSDVAISDKKKNKKEKRKEENTTNTNDSSNPFGDYDPDSLGFDPLVVFAASCLRSMNNDNMEELVSFRDSMPDDVIRHAINRACGNGAPYYNYVKSILNSYVESGFKTVADVVAHEEEKRKKGTSKGTQTPAKTYADPEDFY